MIGQVVSHYKILEKLGEGGMGSVYKAQDLKLGRYAALKFLPSLDEAGRKRFVREAQAASTLDHPNIVSIYGFDDLEDGRSFIAMAYYEGETLEQRLKAGALPWEEALSITLQVARGLERAHREGIVHRDIKPSNVILAKDGTAKIIDFGVAKLLALKTKTGKMVGTLAYLSPEQALGEEVDQRSDVWALGVMLYRMIAGRTPFDGDYDQAVLYSILYDPPPPFSAGSKGGSAELEKFLQKALAKNRQNRFQAMDEMLTELSSLQKKLVSTPGPHSALAVLPFADLSPQRDQEYFCDGLAEELINALTRLRGLRVASRTSTFQFKGKTSDAREVGEKLGVDALLEGSVRKSGERLRVTVKLVNVSDGYHLWSENYDRRLADVFAIQEEIARAVVAKLKVELLPGLTKPLVRRHTEDLEAYNLYLKGYYFLNQRTKRGLERAIEYFDAAVEKDRDYALAYAGIADSYGLLSLYGQLPLSESYTKAKAAADKALEIDPSLAEAHTSRAQITALYEWNIPKAEREFKRAIELDANYATAHHWYSNFLTENGRLEEALLEAQRAQELEPFSLVISVSLGLTYYYSRRYDRAMEQAQKTLELDPNFALARRLLAIACERAGRFVEAEEENLKWGALTDDRMKTLVGLGHVYAVSGQKEKVREVLEAYEAEAPKRLDLAPGAAFIYAALGEPNKAFEWLEKAFHNRSGALSTI